MASAVRLNSSSGGQTQSSPPKPWEQGTESSTAGGGEINQDINVTGNGGSGMENIPVRPASLTNFTNMLGGSLNGGGGYTTGFGQRGLYGPTGFPSYGYGPGSAAARFGPSSGYYGPLGPHGGAAGLLDPLNANLLGANAPLTLSQTLSYNTQATFAMLESIVGAVTGFAQMLESAYMATHSSFFAMVSVAEQFGYVRHTLGSVLGIYTVMRWLRYAVARLTGQPVPVTNGISPAAFAAFTRSPTSTPTLPRASKKPLIFFTLAVFGLPYLMSKLIRALARGQEEQQQRELHMRQFTANSTGLPRASSASSTSPLANIEFCHVLHDYTPDHLRGLSGESTCRAVPGIDVSVTTNDIVAVLRKTDPAGAPCDWWQCRTRDGRVGYLPAQYLSPPIPLAPTTDSNSNSTVSLAAS